MTKWLAEADRIQAAATSRLEKHAHPDSEIVHTGLVMLGFEAVPLSDQPTPAATGRAERARGASRGA
jgi:hypothetical protein